MQNSYEFWVHQRYDLTRDRDGFNCREVVKRMLEVWCHCCKQIVL